MKRDVEVKRVAEVKLDVKVKLDVEVKIDFLQEKSISVKLYCKVYLLLLDMYFK